MVVGHSQEHSCLHRILSKPDWKLVQLAEEAWLLRDTCQRRIPGNMLWHQQWAWLDIAAAVDMTLRRAGLQ